jgi:membrane protein implicated in regulation of membrane protease activity
MSEESRSTLTFVLWLFSAIVLAALFISAAAQGELTPAHVALASVILALAVAGTPYILRMKEGDAQQEKSKRRIDGLINNLNDDELVELKRRLADVEDEAPLADYVGDDGELVRRR